MFNALPPLPAVEHCTIKAVVPNIDNYTNEDETVLQLNDDSIYQEDK
jgi:hypothetical protein